MAVKNFVFANENQFTWRSGQNYTLSYYQLTFSESNRLIVSVIFAWLSIKAISISTKQKKTGAAWSRTSEPQAAHRMKPSTGGKLSSDWKVWLKKWPEMQQPGACVDVLPRCSPGLLRADMLCIQFHGPTVFSEKSVKSDAVALCLNWQTLFY